MSRVSSPVAWQPNGGLTGDDSGYTPEKSFDTANTGTLDQSYGGGSTGGGGMSTADADRLERFGEAVLRTGATIYENERRRATGDTGSTDNTRDPYGSDGLMPHRTGQSADTSSGGGSTLLLGALALGAALLSGVIK